MPGPSSSPAPSGMFHKEHGAAPRPAGRLPAQGLRALPGERGCVKLSLAFARTAPLDLLTPCRYPIVVMRYRRLLLGLCVVAASTVLLKWGERPKGKIELRFERARAQPKTGELF